MLYLSQPSKIQSVDTQRALHAADGTPLALTDSRQAAVGHAMGDELEVAAVH